MKKFHKAVVASAVALAFSAGTIMMTPSPAEAGFGLGDVIGGGKSGGQVDVEGLTDRQNNLLTNLVRSTQCLAIAAYGMNSAAGLGLLTQESEAASAAADAVCSERDAGEMLGYVKSDPLISSYRDKDTQKNTIQANKEKLAAIANSGSEEEKAQVDAAVKTSKLMRLTSDVFVGAAAIDAVKIIKDAGDGIKSAGEAADTCKQILDTTKAAKELLDVRGGVSKMLGESTKDYEKTRKIEKPSDAEIKAAQADIEKG